MSQRHTRSTRKSTGGRTRRLRKPRKYEQGGEFAASTVGEQDVEDTGSRGGNTKSRVNRAEQVNLASDGEVETATIEAVLENPANPDYVRRDLLTKGTLLQTDKGKARVTSRPGQEGTVNAVLVDDE